ncbi:MAG: helix-turn-helix transcriptional regulator [Mitsuaria chitosanitabida]|uniref:helix-turn-helix domain-containing protein n=1 Tax=Roseateles chitosanitabidus TaxID=65048 RepID=UPI001B24B758|nr:helix-turn-helix transcriptional regulator [Roseateles chitosanitabidus]MBO9685690.1 helix-turn-helix transcriptional regulator [Roseateles chitosanitabidus]
MSSLTTEAPELLHLTAEGLRVTAAHAHREGQLVWVRRGALLISAASGRWAQLPGKVSWIPPRCAHEARSFGPLEATTLLLEASLCEPLPDEPRVFGCSPLAALMLQRLEALDAAKDIECRRRLLPALMDVLVEDPQGASHLALPAEPRLQRMALAVLAAPDDRRTLDDWATELGFSRRTLMRRFELETGLKVGHWQRQARLFAGLDLLAKGDSVTTVALSVGYSSVSAFIEQFRRTFGVTPARLQG